MGYQVWQHYFWLVTIDCLLWLLDWVEVNKKTFFSCQLGIDERTGETRNSSQCRPRPWWGPGATTSSSFQMCRSLHDGLVDSMEMASPADALSRNAPASRCCLPQLFHWSPKMRTVVHYVSLFPVRVFPPFVWITNVVIIRQDQLLNSTYSQSEFTLDEGEKLLKEMQDLREDLSHYSSVVEALYERSREVVPLKQRRSSLRQPITVTSICIYKQVEVRALSALLVHLYCHWWSNLSSGLIW